MAKTPKAMTCQGQVMPVSSAKAPTTMAAIPNHKKCTPGRKVSSVNNSAPRMNQFQAPKPLRKADTDDMARILPGDWVRRGVAQVEGTLLLLRAPTARVAGATCEPPSCLVKASRVISASPASEP